MTDRCLSLWPSVAVVGTRMSMTTRQQTQVFTHIWLEKDLIEPTFIFIKDSIVYIVAIQRKP